MKKISLVFLCLFVVNLAHSQKNAVTEIGEEVILYEDGTWKYQNEGDLLEKEILTNSTQFIKDKESTFLLKSTKLNIGVYLDPKDWSFNKSIDDTDAEYELQLKGKDLYGRIITQKDEIPLETMKAIALEHGRVSVPDLRVVKEEYRTVNSVKVLLLQMNGTIQGVNFTYYGYYFSNSNGTVQFVAYTSKNLMSFYLPEAEKLLNGFVEIF